MVFIENFILKHLLRKKKQFITFIKYNFFQIITILNILNPRSWQPNGLIIEV
jgi:hypothetical protein